MQSMQQNIIFSSRRANDWTTGLGLGLALGLALGLGLAFHLPPLVELCPCPEGGEDIKSEWTSSLSGPSQL